MRTSVSSQLRPEVGRKGHEGSAKALDKSSEPPAREFVAGREGPPCSILRRRPSLPAFSSREVLSLSASVPGPGRPGRIGPIGPLTGSAFAAPALAPGPGMPTAATAHATRPRVSRGRRSGRRRGPGRRRGDLPQTHRPGAGCAAPTGPCAGEQLPTGRTGEVRGRQEGAGHDHDLRGRPGTTDDPDLRRTRLDRGRRDRPVPVHAGRPQARTERGVAPPHRHGGPALDRAVQPVLRADSPAGRPRATVTQR